MIDDWQKTGEDGKVTTTPMTEADIKRFTQLVRESIGLKDDRGDQINVMNQAFKNNGPMGPIDGPPLWQNPMVGSIAKQLVGAGLVLLVAFLILRPLMKSLTRGSKAAKGSLDGDEVGRGPREPVGRRQPDQAIAEF